MTYCVGILLEDGFVMVSDSRTNAGVDRVSTFKKMFLFDASEDRLLCLATAGNLSVSQSVVSVLKEWIGDPERPNLYNVPNMFEAARVVGDAFRDVYEREYEHLQRHGVAFQAEAIFGGQIGTEAPRLFRVYEPGNFLEACRETPYFQVGENKYGKPILDRVIGPETGLMEAARCALISFDSTMRSNISVGPPIDLMLYRRDSLKAGLVKTLQEDDPYWIELRNAWAANLKEAFSRLPEPDWFL